MADDIRFSVNFWQHPKTIKLTRKGGLEAVRSLQLLWCFCAQERTDGILSGMDVDDIEIAADWRGEPGRLVELLLNGNWLEQLQDDTYALHGWEERQAYVSKKKLRQEQAKGAAEKRWQKKRGVQPAMPDDAMSNADGMRSASEPHADSNADSCEQHCGQHETAMLTHAHRNAPAPLPDPLPDPEENTKNSIERSKNLDRARARRGAQAVVSGTDFPVLPDSPLSPPPEPCTGTGNEPSLEFLELRAAYSERVRSEGEMTGFVEYKQAKAARDWPGLNAILDDIDKRLTAGLFHTNYGPSLRKYLTERYWKAPIRPLASPRAPQGRARDAPGQTLTERNAATARQVLAELEAEHGD